MESSFADYPEPWVVPPRAAHTHTFILLHGRGDNARVFGDMLLSWPIPMSPPSPSPPSAGPATPFAAAAAAAAAAAPQGTPAPGPGPTQVTTLPALFPHVRFVFPQAPRRAPRMSPRDRINQWFDTWAPADPHGFAARRHWQVPGLQASAAYVHALVAREAALLLPRQDGGSSGGGGGGGKEVQNIVLGGLSQGCATVLAAAMTWGQEDGGGGVPGALVGMCGRVPFCREMLGVLRAGEGDAMEVDGAGPALGRTSDAAVGRAWEEAASAPPHGAHARRLAAARWLRDTLGLPVAGPGTVTGLPIQRLPVFMGHGTADRTVPVDMGRATCAFLREMGVMVDYREYPGLGHWYSDEMLRDLVAFVFDVTDIKREG